MKNILVINDDKKLLILLIAIFTTIFSQLRFFNLPLGVPEVVIIIIALSSYKNFEIML